MHSHRDGRDRRPLETDRHILSDADFSLVLANAAHVKNVPGRKTDVNDATLLADLLAHGLIRGSFVPDQQTQEMRDLLRTRKQLTRSRSRHVQRLQKTLEDANIKPDSVISDIMGLSGRKMIEALITGQSDPGQLAHLAHRRIKASPEELREALRGRATSIGRSTLWRALWHHRPPPDHHSWRRRTERMRHPRRNRPRHEPLPDGRAPDLLGRPVPEERRECGQAVFDPDARRTRRTSVDGTNPRC
jgi:hypothetical protein